MGSVKSRFAIADVLGQRPTTDDIDCCYAAGYTHRTKANTTAATSAEAGIVRTHAHTIRRAIPQRTADKRLVAPTPMIAPVIVCVVLTGIPASAVANKVIAPAVSAQNPPTGLSFVMRDPMV